METEPRETRKREVSQKQAMALDRWEKFLEVQGGCYPAAIAAVKLRMTPQGVYHEPVPGNRASG